MASIFKTATGNRNLELLPTGQVLWPYRDSRTDQLQSITLAPAELIRRFLQHVLPSGFRRVRLFGWLHPAAKLRANRVRALLKQAPWLSAQERQTWQTAEPSELQEFDPAPEPDPRLACPRCGKPLFLIGSWHAGQRPPGPCQPRAP